jgi:dTDP-glucose 4,6-dehydratase
MSEASELVHGRAEESARILGDTWERLRGARIFITGGTGFVGIWLLHVLFQAARRYELDVEATVLTRDAGRFRAKAPELAAERALTLVEGDLRTGPPPPLDVTDVVHAAAETNVDLTNPDAVEILDAGVTMTRSVAAWAGERGVKRLSLISSGAVYARSALDEGPVAEDDLRAPETGDLRAAYGNGKRAGEAYAGAYGERYGFTAVFPRLFAFVGPYLPLDSGFAVGNFLRDALAGREIVVSGDGTPLRSYLDGADMAAWCWAAHLRGRPGRAYNVGGDVPLSIGELAQRVAAATGRAAGVRIMRTPAAGARPSCYVPQCFRAGRELGVRATIDLDAALTLTARWHLLRNAT